MLNANAIVGSHDILLITLDTLRYDVAARLAERAETPNLARLLRNGQWERRHTPGSFTYAAHQAFFAGFLPTPAQPGRHPRLFAARFAGSETSTEQTYVFDAPDIISGFRQLGYYSICIGGVGFFNKQNPLSLVLPSLFDESHWDRSLGVTEPRSTEFQVDVALQAIAMHPADQRVFLFMNVSALHQPNYFYLEGARDDTIETHAAALRYVDSQLGRLFDAFRKRAPTLAIVCSDHGTAYGEDGFYGHRLAHPSVWEVPYTECVLEAEYAH